MFPCCHGDHLLSSIVHRGTGTFFHNIGCELVPTCTRSYITGRELYHDVLTVSWNNFMENGMVQSECCHILERFDETVCLFKLMENAMVPGAELSITVPQAFLGQGDASASDASEGIGRG